MKREERAVRMGRVICSVWMAVAVLIVRVGVAEGVEEGIGDAIVRAQVTPRSAIVGSPMQLRISVLVPTWFTSALDYPSFEVAGLIVRLPPNSSHNIRETVDGAAYVGIVREYQIYPQRAADYLLDDLVMDVEYAHPETRKPVEAELKLRPIRFSATVPAQASDLDPFLATTRLVLEQEVEGVSDELEVGAAVTRTITVQVRDLPAMFIPPLIPGIPDGETPSGLRAYPRSPLTEDLPGQGGGHTTGQRIESVTYVIEEPGDHTLPVLSLRWWNRRRGVIETVEAPAISFRVPVPLTVAGGADPATAASWDGSRVRQIQLGIVVAIMLVLIAVLSKGLRRWARGLFTEWGAWRRRRAESEPVRFAKLQRVARRGELRDLYQELWIWLNSVDAGVPATLASLSSRPGCEALVQSIAALGRALYADDLGHEPGFDGDARASLRRRLKAARRSLIDSNGSRAADDSLPSLNPTDPIRSVVILR